jgi:hypothetical protein
VPAPTVITVARTTLYMASTLQCRKRPASLVAWHVDQPQDGFIARIKDERRGVKGKLGKFGKIGWEFVANPKTVLEEVGACVQCKQ